MCEQNQTFNEQIADVVKQFPTCYGIVLRRQANKHLLDYIMDWTSFIDHDVKLALRIYLTLNAMTSLERCRNPGCSNFIPDSMYLPLAGSSQKHCCARCAGKDPLTLRRREQTCIETYGVTHVSKIEEIRMKNAQSMKSLPAEKKTAIYEHSKAVRYKKYGGYNNAKKISESMKNRTEADKKASNDQRKLTNLSKYGVECTCHTPETKTKAKQSRWRSTYRKFIKDNPYAEPLFTEELFCKCGSSAELQWRCKKCGETFMSSCWKHSTMNMRTVARCLKCYPLNCRESKTETQLCKFLKTICNCSVKQSAKGIIKPYELDMYLEEKHFAVEFNGVYWHSLECGTPASYHKTKTDMCEESGVDLVHIFETEWRWRKTQVQNHLKLLLDNGVKHCKASLASHISQARASQFFESNAVAYTSICSRCLALTAGDEIVFVAEIEYDSRRLVIKQFCFKLGTRVDNAFEAVASYASRLEVQICRDRRLWPRYAVPSSFKPNGVTDPRTMFTADSSCRRMLYSRQELKQQNCYTLHDSGLQMYVSSEEDQLRR